MSPIAPIYRARRRLKVTLACSLLLNVFILGGIAGGALQYWRAPKSAAVSPSATPAPAVDNATPNNVPRGVRLAAIDLSPQRQQEFRRVLRDARQSAAPSLAASREGRQQIRELLVAKPFNPDAVRQAMAVTRDADLTLRGRIEDAVVAFASTLDTNERDQFMQGLRDHGPLRLAPEPVTPAPAPKG